MQASLRASGAFDAKQSPDRTPESRVKGCVSERIPKGHARRKKLRWAVDFALAAIFLGELGEDLNHELGRFRV